MGAIKSIFRTICFTLVIFISSPALATNISIGDKVITGRIVSSDLQPIIGGAVLIKGTNVGAITNINGEFELNVPDKYINGILVFSSVGYENFEQKIGNKSIFNITLKNNLSIDEVVVVGYGAQKKKFFLGSVSQVNSKEIMKAPVSNVTNMVAGKLSGVTAIQRSGAPGEDQSNIVIRGLSSYNNNSPLYIIDGMIAGSIFNINPADIATISVLKDAATAAIYGVKGGNGVILITTKEGSKSGRVRISYDGSVTLSTNTSMPKLLNAQEYIYWHNLARKLDGAEPFWDDKTLKKMDELGVLGDTDWMRLIYNKFGKINQHNVSASGGNDMVSYFSSIGYMGQEGILKNTDFERYNVRCNLNIKPTSGLSYSINMSGRRTIKHGPGYGYGQQNYYNPIQRANYALPLLKNTYKGLPLAISTGGAPISPDSALTESGYSDSNTYAGNITSLLEYSFDNISFLKGLKLSFFGGFNFSMSSTLSFLRSYKLYVYDSNKKAVFPTVSEGIPQHKFTKGSNFNWTYNIRPQVSYERTFGKHSISATALFEKTKFYSDFINASKIGYITEKPMTLNTGSKDSRPANGSHFYTGDVGFAGRVNYAYAEKYLAEFSFRESATYIFAPKNRWGFFPSLSIGWTMSQENFIKDNVSWLNFLKIKGSIGQMGSNDCSPYLYLKKYRSTSPTFFYGIGGKPVTAFYTDGYVYDNLTWSHMTSYNAGFEARLLNNKLTIEFDAFYKYTDRILDQAGTTFYAPSLGGNNPSWVNSGKMDDRGFELNVGYNNHLSCGIDYSIKGMVSWARNKLIYRETADNHPSYRSPFGKPLGIYYGYKYKGIFQTQEEVDNSPIAPSGYTGIGEIMYEDINGDGKFTRDQDYVQIGRPSLPEVNYSFDGEIAWKGISLSFLFYGVAICDYPIAGYYSSTGHTDGTIYTRPFYNGNSFKYLVERAWRPDHTNTKYPRLHAAYNPNNDNFSDLWIVSGAYFRLKNLQLSYTFPEKLTKQIGLNKASIYLAGTNLFTITEFPYLDPENPGVNNGYYPQQKTYSLGFNLTF